MLQYVLLSQAYETSGVPVVNRHGTTAQLACLEAQRLGIWHEVGIPLCTGGVLESSYLSPPPNRQSKESKVKN